jgi:ethanolamine utilization protein EutQ (cupin superfamily)
MSKQTEQILEEQLIAKVNIKEKKGCCKKWFLNLNKWLNHSSNLKSIEKIILKKTEQKLYFTK